jgi:hypothetical protein
MCNSKYTGSNVFIWSLDAEKCFDSTWHDCLFYKLYNVLPDVHCRFLHKWYSNLDVVIKYTIARILELLVAHTKEVYFHPFYLTYFCLM